ncbi:MAG TPA: colanic acid biosynthesis glycosyltransferase WcaL [Gammaproteobacteria bacterium]|nr:colanic acid biosynthesis glycosyltransferase WcaL [Gammaproteobacteria bacterium]
MKIAYLAPEIPGFSSTFVNNEILWLEDDGISVIPISVHKPKIAHDSNNLADRTIYLYDFKLISFIASTAIISIRNPLSFLKSVSLLFGDIKKTGFLKITSAKLSYQFLAANHLARILLKKQCSHLHVHFMDVPAQIAMYASSLSGIPFSITAHANDIFENAFLLRTKSERATKIITISEFNRQYLIKQGVPEDKLTIVRCATKTPKNPKNHDEPIPIAPTIGSLGRLVEKKGMDILLKAIKILIQNGHKTHLQIAGSGPLENELKSLSAELGISPNVTFIGAIANEQVPDWLNKIDIFVLACQIDSAGDMDGIPVVLMEAMAHGVPVISTKLSGIPELVIPNKTGLLAEPGSASDLAKKIAEMINNPETRKVFCNNALQHINSEFSIPINRKRLEQVFSANT